MDTVDNNTRADFADAALRAFCDASGNDYNSVEERGDFISDLIANILHLGDKTGCNPLDMIKRGLSAYVVEQFDPDGMSHEAQIVLRVSVRKYGERWQDGYKPWEPKRKRKRRAA